MSTARSVPGRLPLPEILKVLFPSLVVFVLFLVAFFGVLLPATERGLMEQKKAAIAGLTQTALGILGFYEGQAKVGALSFETARNLAVHQIRTLRYGPEGKDYFWINDLQPAMVMHPYRPDLEGHDLSAFSDPNGKRLFKEFVAVAGRDGAGFVDYMWQRQDDPNLVVPKLSYVELFRPWGWIVGTGVYIEDVRREIAALTRKVVSAAAAILLAVGLLSAFIIRQGLREARLRLVAEEDLRRHQDQLELQVEQRTADLQQALDNVKTLSGFLPICASCKKIRDDKGYWNQIESYIREHSEAQFSHSLCPECAQTLYPEYCDGEPPA
jgi:signal transduction histidine kinase